MGELAELGEGRPQFGFGLLDLREVCAIRMGSKAGAGEAKSE